jgi:DNA-binding MarR family transcriptional regulator
MMPQPTPEMSDDPSSDRLSDQVMHALRRINRAMELHSRFLKAHYGLTTPQLSVLLDLARHQARSAGELARRVHLSQATVTGVLDRLEGHGLIERSRSARDRRRVHLELTPKARALLAGAPPQFQRSFSAQFNRLEQWERTMMLATLQRVVAMMEAPDGPIASLGEVSAAPTEDDAPPLRAYSPADPQRRPDRPPEGGRD